MKLPTPGPFVLVAAVVVSLAAGGVGYAAGSLPKHSVGSAQLKKDAVTAKKIKSRSVTGAKVKDGTLTGADLAAGTVTGAKVAPDSLGGAQIDESTLTVPVKPGSILLTGYDFRPDASSYAWVVQGYGGLHAQGVSEIFTAPIDVPSGAVVTGLKVFVFDQGPSSVDAYVARFVPSTGDNVYSSPVSSVGPGFETLTLTPLARVPGSVQNIQVFLPAGTVYGIFGAQIDYQ